jgi:transcription elongation factor GreA-like protein
MMIKVGSIVSHTGGQEWGAGKIMEVTPTSVMIQFSDGKSRKIAASHFTTLESAPSASFLPPAEAPVAAKAPRAPRVAKKKK